MSNQKPIKGKSLQSMGLEAWMNEFYTYRGHTFLGGYPELNRRFKDGESNAEIGRHFGGRSGQAVGEWRRMWEELQSER
jgi:hypothetical protein